MKYFNIITLFVGVIVNIALYVTTPKYIGIGISENGEVSAVGNLNEDGEKEGYWFYLDSFDSKKITTIVGHYTDNKADSLWIHLYGDVYPAMYASYYMFNDSARGFRYVYNEKGLLDRIYYVWPNQVKYEWRYYNGVMSDSTFWGPIEPMYGGKGNYFFEKLTMQKLNTQYGNIIIFDIVLLSLLLIVNISFSIISVRRKK